MRHAPSDAAATTTPPVEPLSAADPAPAAPARRAIGFRGQLLLIALAAMLPLFALSAALVVWGSSHTRSFVERQMADTAASIATAMDRQILVWRSALEALATAPSLAAGDFATLRQQAEVVAKQHDGWVVLFDETLQQKLNTLRAPDAALPRVPANDPVQRVFATGEPQALGLLRGTLTGTWLVSVSVPVRRDGRVVYALTLAFEPKVLTALFLETPLPAGWRAGLSDENHRLVARSTDIEGRVGNLATPEFIAAVRDRKEGMIELLAITEGPSLLAFRRLARAPWIVSVAVSESAHEEDRRRRVWTLVALLGATAAAAAALAWIASRRMTAPLAALTAAANDLLYGRPVAVAESSVPEIRTLAEALRRAAELVRAAAAAEARADAAEAAQRRQRVLLDELNHRVRNTLATVQSIAQQTLRAAPDCESANATLRDRLIALSRAHDVLTRENWAGADLRELAAASTAPHAGGTRITLEGPPVRLTPRQALATALAFHELCTNAAKHGALTAPDGHVSVRWVVEPGTPPRLRLQWRESGGPVVEPPRRRGFGSRLVEGVARDLAGLVALDFRSEGVVCTIDIPLAELT